MIESSDILAEPVATNRFLEKGSYVALYSTNGAEQLTLGQLANAISVRLAAVYEYRSVTVMNAMTNSDRLITAMSSVASQLVGTYDDDWNNVNVAALTASYGSDYTPHSAEFTANPTVRNFLIYEAGIDAANVPETINTYEKRMSAFKLLKSKLDQATSKSQDLAVTLKTCVNRRDVAYSTSTNVSKRCMSSISSLANALR